MAQEMQKIQRSVFIGLGGTGQSAVLNLKKKLMDVYGEIPAACSFLCFDTDAASSLVDRRGGQVTLSAGEIKKLELRTPKPVLQNPEVTPWWSPATPAKALGRGAGGLRQLGRLALFANAGDVHLKIQGAIQRVSAWPVGRLSDRFQVIDDSVRVHVIGSIAGGTGAGTFLDVGMIAKSLTGSLDLVLAHLLMPDIFVGLPGVHNAERNAYAAAQEIDMLRSMSSTEDHSYQFGGKTISVGVPPFNIVFLINNRNRAGKTYPNLNELTEFIGLGSFLALGATGEGQASVWDNIASRTDLDPWDGRELNYSSYGLAELFFDRERYAEFYTKRIAKGLVDSLFFQGATRDISAEVRNFLLAESLVEDDDDQVIDAILKLGDFTKFVPPQDLTPEALKGMVGRRDGYLTQVDRELDAKASPAAAALRQEKVASLDLYVRDRLEESGGFTFVRSFLESLTGTLEAFRDMMASERERFVEQLRLAGTQYASLAKDADDATKALFGGADRKRKAAANIAKAMMGEASYKIEIKRREEAMAFFATMIGEVNKLIAALTDVSGVAHVGNTELSTSLEKMRTSAAPLKPFELLLEPPGLYDVDTTVSTGDFLKWLSESAKMTLPDLGALRVEAFMDIIERYAADQPVVRRMLAMTIDDAVATLAPPEQERYFKQLLEMSAPLWCYNDGYVTGNKSTELVRMIGFPNESAPTFSEGVRYAAGGAVEDSITSTSDQQRVFLLTAESLLPAFAIDNFPQYREDYLSIEPRSREKYHINRTWIKSLVDLVPNLHSGQSKTWTLAHAMAEIKRGDTIPYGSIKKNGNVYYFVSKGFGDSTKGYEVKLAAGRLPAYEAFMDSPEYLAEVEEQLHEEIRRRGDAVVVESIRRYATEFQKQSGTITQEDVRALARQEITDLESIIEDITTLK